MFPIIGVVQKYAWGKIGNDSEAARLYSKSSEKCVVENDIPYAEVIFFHDSIFSGQKT